MDQLAAMRSFVQVVDKGGFAPAGRALGLSGPMVGNHVRYLEAQLGGLLLNRTTRAQSLTELGQAYLGRCRNILAELEAAEMDAAEMLGSPRGRLRVTAPLSIGSTILPVIISRFLNDYPDIEVDLHLENERADLLPDGFDAAIRVGELDDTGLVTRALKPLELVVCAAPEYIERRGEPDQPAALASHDCLVFSAASSPHVWRFETPTGVVIVPVRGKLKANNGLALREAAMAGAGIILQPRLLVDEEVRRGTLKTLLPSFTPQARPVQVLTLPGQQPTPKLRCFVDALVLNLGNGVACRSSKSDA